MTRAMWCTLHSSLNKLAFVRGTIVDRVPLKNYHSVNHHRGSAIDRLLSSERRRCSSGVEKPTEGGFYASSNKGSITYNKQQQHDDGVEQDEERKVDHQRSKVDQNIDDSSPTLQAIIP